MSLAFDPLSVALLQAVIALLALCGSAVAFTPVGIRPTPDAMLKSDKTVLDMPGIQAPIGFFDPAGFSETTSPEGMLWFRAAELKVSVVVEGKKKNKAPEN